MKICFFDVCLSCVFKVLLMIPRGSDQRLALVDRLTKRLSLLTDIDDVLNFVPTNHGGQSEMQPLSDSFHLQLNQLNVYFVYKFLSISNCLLSENQKGQNQKTSQNKGVPCQSRYFLKLINFGCTTILLVRLNYHTTHHLLFRKLLNPSSAIPTQNVVGFCSSLHVNYL